MLIAAAFCLFNRYVDGLAAGAPPDPDADRESGARLAGHGYTPSTAGLPAAAAWSASAGD